MWSAHKRHFWLVIGFIFFSASISSALLQGQEDPPTPLKELKEEVQDKCGGLEKELNLAPGKYRLSVIIVGGKNSCPVLVSVRPQEGLTLFPPQSKPNVLFSPKTVGTEETGWGREFYVPNDGKTYKVFLQCAASDHDQKDCRYVYRLTPLSASPTPPPAPHPATVTTPPVVPSPPLPPKLGKLEGAPDAKVCRENHKDMVIQKTQGIFILTVYHDSQCPVRAMGGVDVTVEPGQTRIIARKNVTIDEPLSLSCGDSEMNYCRYQDRELSGVTGPIIQETVKTSCKDGKTTLETDAAGTYFLDVEADPKSDCPPEVNFGGATVFHTEPHPVQPGNKSHFGFTVPVGSGPVTVEISCGTDPDKQCIYTYTLSDAKRKSPKPPKLKTP